MKPVFPRSSQSFALVLAVSLTIGANELAHADLMNKVNPMNWFAGDSSQVQQTETSTKAQKRATEAQAQAEQALKAAQEALLKAEQIKKQADELQAQAQQQKQTKAEKPVVKTPEEQITAFKSQETEATEANSTETKEKNGWYTLKLFKKSGSNTEANQEAEVPVSDTRSTFTSTNRSPEVEQASADSQPASKESTSAPWNPMTWFSKPASENATANANQETTQPVEKVTPAPSTDVDLKTKAAVMETEKGNITFELYPDYAPITVNNFAKLISDGFYNRFNMKFHRVVPGFVIQTGDPTGTGAGGSKDRIPLESKNKLSHNAKGIVAMARGADPNSATSQFYITLTPQTSLDGKYTIFGKVIAGMDVLEKIEKDDMLYGIRLVDLDSVVRDPSPDKKRFFSSVF